MATNVHLTPELEKFARSCVEEGRYNNVSEVVRSAIFTARSAIRSSSVLIFSTVAVRRKSTATG